MRKYLLIFGLMTLVLSACRIESNMTFDIKEDGSATVAFEVGVDDEFLSLMSEADASTDDLLEDLGSLPGGDGLVTTRKDGDMNYTVVTAEVDDLSSWDSATAEDGGFAAFSYTFDDEGASLTATLASQGEEDLSGEFGFDPSTLTDEFFSAEVIVHMPGNVDRHNADEVRDGALVWDIPLSGSLDIFAESTFGSSGSPWILIALAGVVTVGIIAALVAIVVTRKESEKAVAAAVAAHGESASPPPPPPAPSNEP